MDDFIQTVNIDRKKVDEYLQIFNYKQPNLLPPKTISRSYSIPYLPSSEPDQFTSKTIPNSILSILKIFKIMIPSKEY